MIKATYKKYLLDFKVPSGTSRGILTQKESWLLKLELNGRIGIGECGILRTLSYDDTPDYQQKLQWTVDNINLGLDKLSEQLKHYPSIVFGLEQAFMGLTKEDPFVLFDNAFTQSKQGININGLIWMGEPSFMKEQIDQKLAQGFGCIKMKIGAIDFEQELRLLAYIRTHYPKDVIELRVDANGGFTPEQALSRLQALSEFELHSIEQPIAVNQHDQLQELCAISPVTIALDEELIGVVHWEEREALLDKTSPGYIILKPSLLGGYKSSEHWIAQANKRNIGHWVTSALESNIGLNAIAQWTFELGYQSAQGLGTGALYTNNIQSPLQVSKGQLHYQGGQSWQENIF